ncbi:hypothetical protein G7Y89_g5726 [Cudoniella acicularis]|uniref:Heterokaryon incompatibility domain-containing protein n=1 Tax=Cudoniella acicularis TaxID=354080 RepID=A0A8H4RLZ3_9HELO|nr:hypothetical protein G7Y89_g5726 [Cudoniella acicularis]
MECNIQLSTRLSIRLASLMLLLNLLWAKLLQRFYFALLLYACCFPISRGVTRNLRLTLGLIIYFITSPLGTGYSKANKAKAMDRALTCGIWMAGVLALHRDSFIFTLTVLNNLLSRLESSQTYLIFHYMVIYILYSLQPAQKLVLRTSGMASRVLTMLWIILSTTVSEIFFDGIEWVYRRRDPIERAGSSCLVNFAEYFVYYLLLRTLSRHISGSDAYNSSLWNLYKSEVLYLLIRNIQREFEDWRYTLYDMHLEDGAESANPYQYMALKEGNIRLVLLHRRHPSALVKCTLLETPFKKAPRFEAMSYTWGNPEIKNTIFVNGGTLRVTANAYDLLQGRSSFWLPRILWIDSICINQKNNPEKGRQVSLMGDIYRKAYVVTVWLCQTRETDFASKLTHLMECHLALDLLEELHLVNWAILTTATILRKVCL